MSENTQNNEESSRLLTSPNPLPSGSAGIISDYGSQTAENNTLLDNMGRTGTTRTLPQYIAALTASGGALAAGILLGWTSPAELPLVENEEYGFPISKEEFSWIGSAMTLGAAAVCIPIGFLINLIGRKPTMLLLVIPFTIGWALLIWAKNVAMMYAARFILGISGGAFCVVAPMYTGEISEKDIRGTLGSYFQMMITIGIFFVYIVGWKLKVYVMSLICATVPLIFGAIFLLMPESPLYLVRKGNTKGAIESMKWLRGSQYDYSQELTELQEEDAKIKENPVSIGSALARKATIKALCISLGLMFFQQLSGINAVIFYTNTIFSEAKTGIEHSVASIIVGIMQVIATFISTLVVDKLGRRILLLASGTVMAACTILMGVYFYLQNQDSNNIQNIGWLPIVCLCVFIVMFSMGYGPVPWLMMGEVFAPDIKGVAGSIAGTTNWILAFIVTKTFVNLKEAIGTAETFWLFSGITLVGVIFVFFVVPETKGKSLQEIQRMIEGENDENLTEPTTNEAKL